MANAAALINEGLWRKDKEFQRLPRLAQCTFCQILSQKDLDTAGGLTLHLELLAKACDELTVEQLMADLAVLEERRFVFVDYDTDELLVRSYVRLVSAVGGAKNRAWLSVPKNARLIASPKLRHELAVELRRVRRQDASELADEIDPLLTPSGPPSDPVGTPSDFEGGPNPHRQVPVPVLVSPSVGGSVGERPPRPECSDHDENSDISCGRCMRRRRWDEKYAEVVKAEEAVLRKQQRSAAIKTQLDCPDCDEYGWVLGAEAEKCSRHLFVRPEAV
jgi:hypothetical protein